jgi:phospholipid/cholesterol/gamma-HCH transport system substrate-binding protein
VTGLSESAAVTANGFKVGQVRAISYEYNNPGHIRVELALEKALKVPEGTVAVLASDLLGTASIQLIMPESSNYAKVGTELQATIASGLMDNVSSELLPSVGAMLPKIDSLLTAINRLAGDPALLASVQRLDQITANLEATTAAVAQASKPLPTVMNNATVMTANLQRMSANLDSLSASLNAMPLNETMENVRALTANLSQLTHDLESNESTLGLLMHDPALYNNLNATVSSLDSLFVDLKAHPHRYLKFSVF